MARNIIFTSAEKVWLDQLLVERSRQYVQTGVKREEAGLAINNARSQLSSSLAVHLAGYQKALVVGCVNEQLACFYLLLNVKYAVDLLNMDKEQRDLIDMIDMAKDMLCKLGYPKSARYEPTYNFDIRFRHSLTAIEKLKQASEVCVSTSGGEVYKIGIITQGQESFVWRLSNDLKIYDLVPMPRNAEQIRSIKKSFEIVTDSTTAAALLSAPGTRPSNSVNFFKSLLN